MSNAPNRGSGQQAVIAPSLWRGFFVRGYNGRDERPDSQAFRWRSVCLDRAKLVHHAQGHYVTWRPGGNAVGRCAGIGATTNSIGRRRRGGRRPYDPPQFLGTAQGREIMTLWTRREDRLALKHAPELVARITGRTLAAVIERQRELEQLPKPSRKRRPWTQQEDDLVLTRPPSEVSRLIGRTFRRVHQRRRLLRSLSAVTD
jgi:hypothetical protein